jgi:hypothetical protein
MTSCRIICSPWLRSKPLLKIRWQWRRGSMFHRNFVSVCNRLIQWQMALMIQDTRFSVWRIVNLVEERKEARGYCNLFVGLVQVAYLFRRAYLCKCIARALFRRAYLCKCIARALFRSSYLCKRIARAFVQEFISVQIYRTSICSGVHICANVSHEHLFRRSHLCKFTARVLFRSSYLCKFTARVLFRSSYLCKCTERTYIQACISVQIYRTSICSGVHICANALNEHLFRRAYLCNCIEGAFVQAFTSVQMHWTSICSGVHICANAMN